MLILDSEILRLAKSMPESLAPVLCWQLLKALRDFALVKIQQKIAEVLAVLAR
jgi:hypothetical protein